MRIWTVLLIVTTPLPAAASEWWHVGVTSPFGFYYVDVESIRQDGRRTSFWSKSESVEADSRGVKSTKLRWSLDCEKMTGRLHQSVSYREDGTVHESVNFNDPEESGFVPDTLGENVANFVCSTPANRNKYGRPPGGLGLLDGILGTSKPNNKKP